MKNLLTEWKSFLEAQKKKLPAPIILTPDQIEPVKLTYSVKALDLIKKYEKFSSEPYDDKCRYPKLPDGKFGSPPKRTECHGTKTIGYGTTIYPNDVRVTLNDAEINEAQATEFLKTGANEILDGLNKFINIIKNNNKLISQKKKKGKPTKIYPLNQNQIDALISFGYNLGRPDFVNSRLFTIAIRTPNDPTIPNLFREWAGGGRSARREEEIKLYLTK